MFKKIGEIFRNRKKLAFFSKKDFKNEKYLCIYYYRKINGGIVLVFVRDDNVDQALRALKKKMQREGIFKEIKLRRHFEKPSEKRVREKSEAIRRTRKLLRKRLEREGY